MNNLTDTQHLEQEEQHKYRIPPEHKGIQINYCKNPECENYGIPAAVSGNFKLKDNKASLHAVDNYFMLIRRRIAMLERPMHSSANAGRVWNGYGAYNPVNVAKLLTIFRTFYNYMLVGADRKTPAMRLGLMDKAVEYDELIEFKV